MRELQNEERRRIVFESKGLDRCGVYAIVCSPDYQPTFISQDKARGNRNVVRPWPVEKLQERWVNGVEVLYFGKTGTIKGNRDLRGRLTELIRHSLGEARNHRGGEIVWQLSGYEGFEVCYAQNDEPNREEGKLIRLFRSQTGKPPFANRQVPQVMTDVGFLDSLARHLSEEDRFKRPSR